MVKLFTMQGRITRQQYVVTSLVISVVGAIIAFGVGFAGGMAGVTEESASNIGTVLGLAVGALQALLIVRRLHDIGKPGWHFWLFAIPLYNFYLGIVLLFTPGTRGANQYGPDPSVA